MRTVKLLVFAGALASLTAVICAAQDSPPLGDVARTQRQKQTTKQAQKQTKTDSVKATKTPKIITNDELPERAVPVAVSEKQDSTVPASSQTGDKPAPEGKQTAEHWKSQILAQKNQISSMQAQIDDLNESIQFAPANCVANCVAWNEHQKEKQEQVERMRMQLEDEKKRLDDMQESARQQGYGSSVYDP